MRPVTQTVKLVFYLVAIVIATPLLWVLRRNDKFEGEVFADYDDDDIGEDVDE